MSDTDSLPEQGEEAYIGDGVYVQFDGYQLLLRAPRDSGDHLVALEPAVYKSLRDWIARYPRLARHMESR